MNLADYDALSFDCYGTLIDWEAGIAAVLAPWAKQAGLNLTDEQLLVAYAENEAQTERDTPDALYSAVLAEAFRRTGDTLGRPVNDEWAQRLGDSVPDWPAFPDSAEALISGKHACLDAWRGFFDSFPDYRNVFTSLTARDDVVSIVGYSECAESSLAGPAIWTATIQDETITEWRVYADTADTRTRLGIPDTT